MVRPGLADLEAVRPPARVDGRARGADGAADHLGQLLEDDEVLRPLEPAAARARRSPPRSARAGPSSASSRRSTSFMLSAGHRDRPGAPPATSRPPAAPPAGRRSGRSVASHGAFAHVIFDEQLARVHGPRRDQLAVLARRAPVESAASPAPSRAASRAISSRCRVVTGAEDRLRRLRAASSAMTGVHTSPRYGANAAFSKSQMRLAPQLGRAASRPSGVALSVSHTASACAARAAPAQPARPRPAPRP